MALRWAPGAQTRERFRDEAAVRERERISNLPFDIQRERTRGDIESAGIQAAATTEAARIQAASNIQMQQQREAARTARISGFQSFMNPLIQQFATQGAIPDRVPGEQTAAQKALEETILRRGEEAQGVLSSQMARRGIYAGGASAAAAAKMQAEIESNVALSSAKFEEQESQRRSQEKMSRQQAFSSLMSNISRQLGAM